MFGKLDELVFNNFCNSTSGDGTGYPANAAEEGWCVMPVTGAVLKIQVLRVVNLPTLLVLFKCAELS